MAQGQRLLNPGGLMGQAPPQVAIAQPLNDIQLVALMASNMAGDPLECVEKAQEIVAYAIVKAERITELVAGLKREPVAV